jgi:aromatic-L-amino-acid/L-tryptophan decarboxylase
MRRRLPATDPEERISFDRLLLELDRDVLPFASRDHPGFVAFVTFAGTWPGALGDLIASACNVYAGSWMESPGPSHLELEVLDWFRRWIGYPARAGGLLTSGGSAANMTALACARETLAGPMSHTLVAYVSDQAHSSLGRSARVLGFRPDQVRVLPTEQDYRLAPETLAAAIDADLRAGRRPVIACANGGATNTGAVDPLAELAALCRERGVWFHVDAAYGGFAALTQRGQELLAGIERADSVTLDPHKWLYQPYECGCLLVRERERLRQAFTMTPDYLRDALTDRDEVNFADLGTQLTRSARALKVWVSIRYFGLGAFRAAVDRSLDLAARVAQRVEASARLELAAPPSLSVVCVRRRFDGVEDEGDLERRHGALARALEESGHGLLATTRLRGRLALRMCILGHRTEAATLDRIVDFLDSTEIAAGAPERRYERDASIERTWAEQPAVSPARIRTLPLFAALSDEQAERVARAARVREAAEGDTVVAQWDQTRDFYAIDEGAVDVFVDGAHVGRRVAGEFFGELAALDWGSGFAYSRLATVSAAAPTRLLVFSSESLNEFVHDLPSVGEAIRSAVRARLDHASA